MARTLADMTPEERQASVGMWCDCNFGDIRRLYLFQGWTKAENPILMGTDGSKFSISANRVTPQFGLPRAWDPDGLPVKGEWVEGHMWWGEDTDTMETVDVVGAECLATGQIQGFDEWPDGVTPGEDVPVRRFITEWEATDE